VQDVIKTVGWSVGERTGIYENCRIECVGERRDVKKTVGWSV